MNPLFCSHPLHEITGVYMGKEIFSSKDVAQVSMHELVYLYVSWSVKCPLEERSFCIKKTQQKNTNGEKSVDLIYVYKYVKGGCK